MIRQSELRRSEHHYCSHSCAARVNNKGVCRNSQEVTDDELRLAAKAATSVTEACLKLGIPHNSGYVAKRIKERMAALNIDCSHFTGSHYNKGKPSPNRIPASAYLTKNGPRISSHKLKLKLIEEGIKEAKCECCGRSEWEGKPISLELHHKDGDHSNNELRNLEIRCRNCHGQTTNFCTKNRKTK